jgi:hypothetical protein
LPQPTLRRLGCLAALTLGAAACAPAATTALHTHGEVPRDGYGQPVWAAIEPSTPHPAPGPIFVPAGPPIRTAQAAPAQVATRGN